MNGTKRTIYPGLNDGQTGQPSPIDKPYVLPDGTRTTVGLAVVHYIGQGNFLETACSLVGIAAATAREWLRVAARTNIRTQTNTATDKLTQHETNCLKFYAAHMAAKAEHEHRTLEALDQIGYGGKVQVTTRERYKFDPEKDDNPDVGTLVERNIETRILPPDPQALTWRLAMRNPGRFSPKLQIAQVEDVALTDEEEAEVISEAFAAYLQGRQEVTETSEPSVGAEQ